MMIISRTYSSFEAQLAAPLQSIESFADELSYDLVNKYITASIAHIRRNNSKLMHSRAIQDLFPFYFKYTSVRICVFIYETIKIGYIKYDGVQLDSIYQCSDLYKKFEDFFQMFVLPGAKSDCSLLDAYKAFEEKYLPCYADSFNKESREFLLEVDTRLYNVEKATKDLGGSINPKQTLMYFKQHKVAKKYIPEEIFAKIPEEEPKCVLTENNKARKGKKGEVTQDTMATLCDVSLSLIKKWEKGISTPKDYPGRDSLIIAQQFAVGYKSLRAVNREGRAIQKAKSYGNMDQFSESYEE